MFASTNSTRNQIAKKFSDKSYRDAFVSSHLFTNVASQIFSLREKEGWTQATLAEETGMRQGRISVMENPNYDKFNIKTLLRFASVFNVALIVRFVPFSEVLGWSTRLSESDLAPASYDEDDLSDSPPADPDVVHGNLVDIWSAAGPLQLEPLFPEDSTPTEENIAHKPFGIWSIQRPRETYFVLDEDLSRRIRAETQPHELRRHANR